MGSDRYHESQQMRAMGICESHGKVRVCPDCSPARPASKSREDRAEDVEDAFNYAVQRFCELKHRSESTGSTDMTRDLGRKQGLQDAAKVFGSLVGATIPAESVAAALLEMAK